MDSLTALGSAVGTLLKERKQTLAVAESSAGGLINAALVAVREHPPTISAALSSIPSRAARRC